MEITAESLKAHSIVLSHHRLAPNAMVALLLCQQSVMSMGDISEACGTSSANMTGTVDRLVEHGYLSRAEAPEDRRKVMVSLTKSGDKLINEILKNKEKC